MVYRLLPLVLAALLSASGCSLSTVTYSYVLEHDPTYIGESLDTSGQRRLGEFRELKFTGAKNTPSPGDVILFRRVSVGNGSHEDLVVVRTSAGLITDAILLTGDTSGVWLGVACKGSNPVVLSTSDGHVLKAWTTNEDWKLVELPVDEVTPEEVAQACTTNRLFG
jgi:hypothetical protein